MKSKILKTLDTLLCDIIEWTIIGVGMLVSLACLAGATVGQVLLLMYWEELAVFRPGLPWLLLVGWGLCVAMTIIILKDGR